MWWTINVLATLKPFGTAWAISIVLIGITDGWLVEG
jgi:hypothetical protein